MEKIIRELNRIQKELKAPKNQFNKFGKYKYRNCEDIVEGIKLVLGDNCSLIITDELVMMGERFYVKATAKLYGFGEVMEAVGFAREVEIKKGMDIAQITGSTSSYARKYALNGLFAIDDTKDADDATNHNDYRKEPAIIKPTQKEPAKTTVKKVSENQLKMIYALANKVSTVEKIDNWIKTKYKVSSKKDLTSKQATEVIGIMKEQEKK